MSAEPTLGDLGIVARNGDQPWSFDHITEQLDLDVEHAYMRAANRHLARIRQVVNEHNLHRHTLTISRGFLGYPQLKISDVPWYALGPGQPASVALMLLGEQIEEASDTWGKHLIDVVI